MDLVNISETLSSGLVQYADFGFALLVGGICLRTLLFDREANTKQRAIWKHELLELEKSLRELIDEASHASEVFDRQLNTRQKTLESLVEKSESLLKASISNSVKTNSRDRLRPNEIRTKKSNSTRLNSANNSADWIYGDDLPNHLASALEESDDVVLNQVPVQNKKTQQIRKEQQIQSAENSKAAEEEQQIIDEKIFSQTSIVDPVAFRIAKRLLLEGKELHVIARKLEIPVSEIRHLEMLIRQHAQSEHVDLPDTFKSKEIETVKKVIRDPAERKQKQKSLSSQVQASSVRTNQVEINNYGLSFEDDTDLPSELF